MIAHVPYPFDREWRWGIWRQSQIRGGMKINLDYPAILKLVERLSFSQSAK